MNIKDEIKNYLWPSSPEQNQMLETQILEEGVRDPLVIAKLGEEEFLADGHHRYDICQRHNLSFETVTKEFTSLEQVKLWIDLNQSSKRNLSEKQLAISMGRAYLAMKKNVGAPIENKNNSGEKVNVETVSTLTFDEPKRTRDIVAKQFDVSDKTVQTNASLAKAYTSLVEDMPTRKTTIDKLNKKETIQLAKLDNKERVVELLSTGQAIDVKQATKIVQQNQRKEEVKLIVDTNPNIVVKHGDAVEQLKTIEANSIDCVVTDSPYGVNYSDSRETFNTEYKDETQYALKLLDETCNELKRVCKEDAHLYFFSGYINMFEFKTIISKYFNVHDNPIIWVKNNHTLCDFTKRYASKYEIIWFCSNKQRMLNNPVSPDVLTYSIPLNKQHSAQKPVELLEYLIKNSTVEGEVVLDCFAGSGSTGVACKHTNRKSILIELEEENINLIKDNLK